MLLVLLVDISAFAADDDIFTDIHHHYQSPRALGMGDAFVAVANDYSAILYNPAGLARLEEGQINLSVDVAASKTFSTFAKDTKDLGNSTGTNSQKYTKYADYLDANYGSHFQVRTSLLNGFWVRPHWGIAVIPIDFTVGLAIHKQGVPALNVKAYGDSTVAFGYGRDIKGLDGRLSWGATAKFVNREFYSGAFNALDLAIDTNLFKATSAREGYTMDGDLGLLYTPHIPPVGWGYFASLAKPTFGAVIRNVAASGFKNSLKIVNKDGSGGQPEPMYRVLDIGSKFEFPNLWIFGGRAVYDVRDIGHPYFNTRKGTHLGVEFDWSVSSWWKGQWRAGVNQGYFTAGMSALFTILRLDIVTYGEDIGSYGAPKENRMYMIKLNVDI